MAKRQGSTDNMDIRAFLRPPKEKNLKIKPDDDSKSEEVHSHKFILKFKKSEEQNQIQCDHPQTVFEAITSKPEIQKKIKRAYDKIILQKGEELLGTAIATHFPCSLLQDGELIILMEKHQRVEERGTKRDYRVYQDEHYYVVYIQTTGGKNTTTKKLFRSSAFDKFSQLCVYGTENMTLKDAIERDGRFVELGDFKLENTKDRITAFCSEKIKDHEGKTFRISLPINTVKKADESAAKEIGEAGPHKTQQEASEREGEAGAAAASKPVATTRYSPVSDILKTKQATGSSEEVENIYELLRNQFPKLREILENRFKKRTFQATVKRVDFGKAQQVFSEVARVNSLFELGESVCKIKIKTETNPTVKDLGSGFVLFKCYILTNAHLFTGIVHNNSVQPDFHVLAEFNIEKSKQTADFKVKNTFIDYDGALDYVILELEVSEENKIKVPPGLMKHCSPMPESGEACIIGHPNGGVKQFDPTCVIEKENREKEVSEHLQRFNDDMFTLMSVCNEIKGQGIERILSPTHAEYENVTSYHTFMYHGSSGSPVFDAHCRVFGMHSAGFVYGFGSEKHSVIEFAQSLLLIFRKFVSNLRGKNNTDLLRAVEEESENNSYLREILTGEETMDVS